MGKLIFDEEDLEYIRDWWQEQQAGIELDLGCGSSDFVHNLALNEPASQFLACDWNRPWCLRGAKQARDKGIRNLRYANMEAHKLVASCGQSASVGCIYLLYPSPLPRSQRLINDDFVFEAYRVLQPGGELWIATDSTDYFDEIQGILGGDEWEYLRWVRPFPHLEYGLLAGTPCEDEYGTKHGMRVRKKP